MHGSDIAPSSKYEIWNCILKCDYQNIPNVIHVYNIVMYIWQTFSVNAAYEALRGLIPTEPVNRKLSKIEIIRLASSYINHLRSTLHTGKWNCSSKIELIIV